MRFCRFRVKFDMSERQGLIQARVAWEQKSQIEKDSLQRKEKMGLG